MTITGVERNNRKRIFSVTTAKSVFSYPFAKLDPPPTKSNPLDSVWIDDDLVFRDGDTKSESTLVSV